MQPKLLANKELDNYVEQDSFDFLTKAEAIKYFLEFNSTSLEKNKMLVLYGEWGSGKTSLMNYINDAIDSKIYKPIFFHAWEHEKDENLALSLCDVLTDCLEIDSIAIIKDFMKSAIIALKGFTSGITLKSSTLLSGIGIDLELSGEKVIENIEKAISKSETPSFYKSNKEFKDRFRKIEEAIVTKFSCQKILILVDDLDRCEPENVLNLITALKLFFTFGNNTVYFCGIDRDAVTKAVKSKYKDVVKSEEYLEKVFDVAFNMPKTFSLARMLASHFHGEQRMASGQTLSYLDVIEDFFKSIRFTNPRHLKKVINKYEILKFFKASNKLSGDISELIPNINREGNKGNLIETVFCLFFIILYEFNLADFEDLENYRVKISKYIEPVLTFHKDNNTSAAYSAVANNFTHLFEIKNIDDVTIRQLFTDGFQNNLKPFPSLILAFSHSHPRNLNPSYSEFNLKNYSNSFADEDFLTLFCKFLFKYESYINTIESDYKIWNLFKMVKYLL